MRRCELSCHGGGSAVSHPYYSHQGGLAVGITARPMALKKEGLSFFRAMALKQRVQGPDAVRNIPECEK